MKIKDFLEWFSGIDPESELKFKLFEEIYDENMGCCKEVYTSLEVADANYLDETDTVFVTLGA